MTDPSEARTELFNIDWRETSFVPAGDNPPARLVMWKSRDTEGITEEEIEEILDEVAEPEGDGPLTKFRRWISEKFGKQTPDGQMTYNDLLQSRQMEAIHKEIRTYVSSLEEALAMALYGPPLSEDGGSNALEQSVDEFSSAIKSAIPLWRQGKASLAKEDLVTEPVATAPAPTRKEGSMPLTDEQKAALEGVGREAILSHYGITEAPAGETPEAETDVQKMLKDLPEGSPLRKHLETMEKEREEDRKRIEKMEEDRASERLTKRAREIGAEDPSAFAKELRSIEKSLGEEAAEKVAKQIEAANAKAKANITDLTKLRQDPSAQAADDSALGKANKLAAAKVEAAPEKFGKMSPNAAIATARGEVWKEHPELREEYEAEAS